MSRKVTYSVLALPIVVFVIYFVTLPSATRKTFLSEFKHRTALLFGAEPETPEGPKGLRLERPEEYGIQPGADEEASTEGNAAAEKAASSDERQAEPAAD